MHNVKKIAGNNKMEQKKRKEGSLKEILGLGLRKDSNVSTQVL